MANYEGKGRSNYFKVKDIKKFKDFIEEFSDLSFVRQNECGLDGLVGFLVECESGTLPVYRGDEDTREEEEIDFVSLLAEHLQEGQVAIIQQIGSEKLRYLSGTSIAVNSKGEALSVDLNDIYELVNSKWRIKDVETCEY